MTIHAYVCPNCHYEVPCTSIRDIPVCPHCTWSLEKENAPRMREAELTGRYHPYIPMFITRLWTEKKLCPNCGYDGIRSTLVAYVGKDMNEVKCSKCLWEGFGYELKLVKGGAGL